MIQDEVFALLSDLLDVPVEKISMSSRFKKDLGADSLDMVDVYMCVEEEFGVTIGPDEEGKKAGDLVEVVKRKAGRP